CPWRVRLIMPHNRDLPKKIAVWLGALGLSAFLVHRGYTIYRASGRGPTAAASTAPSASAVAEPSAVPHVPLDVDTRRKMKLAPRRRPSGGLAFGKGRLGQVTAAGLA